MNLSSMVTLVRRDLKDEDAGNYRWQDNELERAIARALAELSRYCPREMKSTVATTDGKREIDVSGVSGIADRISIDRVEFPVDSAPRSFQRFSVYGDIITLIGDAQGDGKNCYVYWSCLHTLSTTSTVPTYLEDVLAQGAAAYAVLAQTQHRVDTAGFGGVQADRDYQTWGNAMLKEFTRQLRRFGKSRKLKVGQLYQGDDSE